MKNVTALEIMAKTISKFAYIHKPYDIIVSIYKYTINCKLVGTKYKDFHPRSSCELYVFIENYVGVLEYFNSFCFS